MLKLPAVTPSQSRPSTRSTVAFLLFAGLLVYALFATGCKAADRSSDSSAGDPPERAGQSDRGESPKPGQSGGATESVIPIEPGQWEFFAEIGEVTEHLGRSGLTVRGGMALMRDTVLSDGVIEFDMYTGNGTSFPGVIFHVQEDRSTYEKFYVRPFIRATSPEVTQYTPVFHHNAGWQLYHGPNFNQPVYAPNREWFRIKIVILNDQADVYVANMDEPLLHIDSLRVDGKSGGVGMYVEPIPRGMDPAAVYFSNVRVSTTAPERLRGQLRAPETPPGVPIPVWQVSEAFPRSAVSERMTLDADEVKMHRWTAVKAEPSGRVDVGRVQAVAEDRVTVFARATLKARRATVKRLSFGYTERASVFLNGRKLFAGDDTWHSRDVTFQGVAGYWYELYLPLQAGDNELWLAVSEHPGMQSGWGFLAALGDLDGIELGE